MTRRYTAFGRLLEETEPDLYACYVHFNDHQLIYEELSRCQARIGELEVQLQQWKERANRAKDDPLGLFVCPNCYAVTPTDIQSTRE